MTNDVKVMSARAVKTAVSALAQQFSRDRGHLVTCEFSPVGAVASSQSMLAPVVAARSGFDGVC